MDDDDDPKSKDYDPSLYLSLFRGHLAEFRVHLAGGVGVKHATSRIPPTGYWTPAEKDVFFHALSIHSSLRPDLIAAQLEHKSVVDVCAYLDILAQAAAEDRRVTRRELEIAMEMSDEWVSLEEEHGSRISELEAAWDSRERRKQQREIVKSEKALALEGVTDENERRRIQLEIAERTRDRTALWDRERVLGSLEGVQLRTLQHLFLKEDAEQAADPPPTLSLESPLAVSDSVDPRPVAASIPAVSSPLVFNEANIDPELLADSAAMHRVPASQPPPQSAQQTLPKQSNATPDPGEEVPPDLNGLSYEARRRIQRRLYMRRKRAEAKGTLPILDPGILATGRKRMPLPPQKKVSPRNASGDTDDEEANEAMGLLQMEPGTSTSSAPQAVPINDGEDGSVKYRQTRTSGKTKSEQFKTVMREQSIDAAALREMNLELFNFAATEKMMALYRMAYTEPGEAGKKVTSSISADTFRLLHNILVEFITEALHRSIIFREQENRLKANVKVWRRHQGDKELITPSHIHHVLKMMGMSRLSKDNLFGKFFDDSENSDEGEEEEDSVRLDSEDLDGQIASEGGSEARNEREPVFTFLAHREMLPPLVRVASAEGEIDDSCMAVDTDEDELMAELQEEEELDHEDIMMEEKYETNLWDMGFVKS